MSEPSAMKSPLLDVRNLRLGFAAGKQVLAAVDGISFSIASHRTTIKNNFGLCSYAITINHWQVVFFTIVTNYFLTNIRMLV